MPDVQQISEFEQWRYGRQRFVQQCWDTSHHYACSLTTQGRRKLVIAMWLQWGLPAVIPLWARDFL